MVDVALLAVCVGLPVVSLAAVVAGLAYRRARPLWLLALAIIPPIVLLPLFLWWWLQGDFAGIGVLLALPPLVSVSALAWAVVKRSRGQALPARRDARACCASARDGAARPRLRLRGCERTRASRPLRNHAP